MSQSSARRRRARGEAPRRTHQVPRQRVPDWVGTPLEGFCVCGMPCPECGTPTEVPGFVEWSARILRKIGELPPADLVDTVPPGSLWWCPGCDNGGGYVPSPEDLDRFHVVAGPPHGWHPPRGA